MWSRVLSFLLLLVPLARAQNGDKAGEAQPVRIPREKIPPAPPLSPAVALKTFQLPPGFRIELVASEPLVEMPIALAFDPDGRIWVVEMRGFMPNPDGKGELAPVGRVAVLEDTDGDGQMDRRTIFLDGLIMPRAICLARDGALVAEPPHLWFCRDTNGDGICDEKTAVASDYGDQRNPEHNANGLLRARDNWIYSLYHPWRYRNTDGKWRREPTINRVQWGLAQDDFGRLFYTSNSDQLRGDLIPSHYANKPGVTNKLKGLLAQIATNQSVWPRRINPGVNRGYQPEQLRADGTLATFTAACGTGIYRGDNFPADCYGNAFVCEPAGNLVRRDRLFEQDGVITATNAYEKAEFLTSTDERFRPVNVYTGPDGTLYVVDMYHGIIQHRMYMTSYLRKQVEERGLDQPQNQGRIYRVVHESKPPGPKPSMSKQTSGELVRCLSHPNGWWRDTAQRLLVERAEASTVPELKKLAATCANPLARLHALWTLEGMDQLDVATLVAALDDAHPKIRAAALRLSEAFLKTASQHSEAAALRDKVMEMVKDPSADVQLQLALTLGEAVPDQRVKGTLATIARQGVSSLAREAALFSLASFEPLKASPAPAVAKGPPLTAEEQKRFEMGKLAYEATCLPCHQPHGMGQEGLAPPLAGSEWVAGSDQRLARIVLHGLRGPIKVQQQVYALDMPALAIALDDDQVAAVLTYVRRQWGQSAAPVDPAIVKKIRDETAQREDAWTEAELLKIP